MTEKTKLLLPTRTNIFISKLVRIYIFYQVSLLLLSTEDSKTSFLLVWLIKSQKIMILNLELPALAIAHGTAQ